MGFFFFLRALFQLQVVVETPYREEPMGRLGSQSPDRRGSQDPGLTTITNLSRPQQPNRPEEAEETNSKDSPRFSMHYRICVACNSTGAVRNLPPILRYSKVSEKLYKARHRSLRPRASTMARVGQESQGRSLANTLHRCSRGQGGKSPPIGRRPTLPKKTKTYW